MSLESLTSDARDELAALAKALAENPKTRKEFLKLTKTAHPDLPVPEIEIEEQTNRAISAQEAKIAALEARLREKEAKEELSRRRNTLKEKGLAENDDDIKMIEKIMVEKGINNHETAAQYIMQEKQLDRPTPVFNGSTIINKMGVQNFLKNPVAAAREQAAQAFNELRGNSRQRPIGLG